MSVLLSIFWLLVLIGVMILVHELGHFWAARFFDVRVDVFSFGFGPRLFGFKRGDTDYRFSAILFGGYVKMAGEQAGEEAVDDPRGFMSKPRWQRLIIAFAGPFMNVVLAIVLLTGLFMVRYEHLGDAVVAHVYKDSPAEKAGVRAGDKIINLDGRRNPTWEDVLSKEIASADRKLDVTLERQGKLVHAAVVPAYEERIGFARAGWESIAEISVGAVTSGMPAAKAGLKQGDVLLSVNGQPIHSIYTLQEAIFPHGAAPITLQYSRNGDKRTVQLVPEASTLDGKPRFLIGVTQQAKRELVIEKLGFADALSESLYQNKRSASLIYSLLRGILERRMSAKVLDGPVGIARASREAAEAGPLAFIQLMSLVSINLAVFNLLPIPILDGGMILVLLIEMLLGRDLSMSFKEGMLKVGFVFLMAVVVFVLYNDISKVLTQG